MPKAKYPQHEALNPFFEVVMKGLKDFVDGDHYFDTIADDAEFEFLYRFPGWPEKIHGREDLIALYSGYGDNIKVHQGDNLAVHYDKENGVVVLEYQVHGKILRTGAGYDNRFVSIVTIRNRKIVRWRDYMDSLAAWQALSGN
ncbi:MAG: nuclear transport factor 2 family protein [Negativicutes bacterium]|nr:nuclear transport factor 2 family protein [Negativicutes bacterium]